MHFFRAPSKLCYYYSIPSGIGSLFRTRSQWDDVSHICMVIAFYSGRESVRGGVNLVQSSFSHSLVYNRVSKYMGHTEDSIASSNHYLYHVGKL